MGRQTWEFAGDVRILSTGVVTGPKEGQGPLSGEFDKIYNDLYAGESTWEKAERKLLKDAIASALEKAGVSENHIDVVLAGDLLNQITSSSFAMKQYSIPYIGMFGACSTSMETLAVASALVNAGYATKALACCSSHNATAERQFRYPTEYGGQKPPYAQWTVTGAGVSIVGTGASGPKVTHATIGRVVDYEFKDPFDMGTAMAPAAADTLTAHFEETGRKPSDYDLIVTGDLAGVGAPIMKELMQKQGYDITEVYQDCGLMIFGDDQDVMAGGSGCASSAVVTYSHIYNGLQNGTYKRVLVIATGALLSPVSYQQGETIPCIAHAVAMEGGDTA